MDRDITKIQREEAKVKAEVRSYAKKNQLGAARTLAKSVVQTRNQINHLMSAKAQINSVCMQIKEQLAVHKVAGVMQKSTNVMKSMHKLISVPQLTKISQDMQKEMMKAGLMSEMVSDAMESLDPENLESEADEHVEKVLQEILHGQLADVGHATKHLDTEVEEEVDEEKDLDDMKARLAKLNA